MTAAGAIDRDRLRDLAKRELEAFVAARPRSTALWEKAKLSMPNGVPMSWHASSYGHPPLFVAEGKGSRFRDLDGFEYADFNIADMSMFCGYAPEPVVEAIARSAAAGTQFLLPNEDAIVVAEELGRRFGLPKWQFTLAATSANTEAIRVARAATGRDKVLVFDGKYHGHLDDTLVDLVDGRLLPEERGLPSDVMRGTKIVQFNDVEAVRAALEPRDVAILLTEPALTNNFGLQLPDEGFHAALRELTRGTGTVLAYDETHTHVVGPSGCTGLWGLEPDVVTIGKAVAGGVPIGAYGMRDDLAAVMELPDRGGDWHPAVATGGTLFGNPLSMAAARAVLCDVLTPAAYDHAASLGGRLADGIEAAIRSAGLAWTAHRFGPRSGTTFAPAVPRNALEARAAADPELSHLARLYLANRGVWEAIVGAGPTVSLPATREDVDGYVEAYGALLGELTS